MSKKLKNSKKTKRIKSAKSSKQIKESDSKSSKISPVSFFKQFWDNKILAIKNFLKKAKTMLTVFWGKICNKLKSTKKKIEKLLLHIRSKKVNLAILLVFFAFLVSTILLIILADRKYVLTHTYKVGILRTENTKDYSEIYDGFTEGIEVFGNSKGLNIEFLELNSNGNGYYSKIYAKQLASSDCDVILTIGEKASTYLNMEDTDGKSIVFAGVADPKSNNLVESNSTPNGNFTGVSDYKPCFEQVKLIRELFAQCKNIGITYDATNKSSITQINIAETQAKELGITLNKYPIYIESQIDSIINEMSTENDVIYLTDDSVTINNLDKILDYFIGQKLPVIGTNAYMVERGCLATYDTDYLEIGTDACMMVLDIIVNNAETETMPVVYTSACKLYFNTKTADKIGYKPSDAVITKAEKI